jgi:tetraacyldisaccharide 4'-kinase
MLLAACAPTFVGPDRARMARMAIESGAQCLVMDDGLQNPTLQKQSLLVIDGEVGVGNGRVIPAGPLREPLAAAAARCRAAIVIGADVHGVSDHLGIPVLRARLESTDEVAGLRLFAFAGIGRPEKFFASLRAAGAEVVATRGFGDHHRYRSGDIASVLKAASKLGADAVTTPKDAVRLTAEQRGRLRVVGVRLVWDDPDAVERLLDAMLRAR